jgi:hypothetical protein
MEVPGILRLQANDWAVFAVIGAMCANDTDVFHSIVFCMVSQELADFLAAALLTLLACADVNYFCRCVFFFAHGHTGQLM